MGGQADLSYLPIRAGIRSIALEVFDLLVVNITQAKSGYQNKYHRLVCASTMAALDKFMGNWETFGDYENWEELMKELGVGWITRKAAKNATVYGNFKKDGEKIDFKWKLSIKSGHAVFLLGEEFEEWTPDGRKVTSKMYMEGDTFVHVQVGEPYTTTIKRTIEEDGTMTEVLEAGSVTCTKHYKRSEVEL